MTDLKWAYPLVRVPTNLNKSPFERNKKEAKEYFEWFCMIKEERIGTLCRFIKEHTNAEFKCDFSRESLNDLLQGFHKVVHLIPMTKEEITEAENKYSIKIKGDVAIPTKKADDATVSFCFDAGIYFGETIRKHVNGLNWTFNSTAKSFIDYAEPILTKTGMKVSLNPRRIMRVVATKVSNNTVQDDHIVKLFDVWKSSFS
jgi:hypothetical protein